MLCVRMQEHAEITNQSKTGSKNSTHISGLNISWNIPSINLNLINYNNNEPVTLQHRGWLSHSIRTSALNWTRMTKNKESSDRKQTMKSSGLTYLSTFDPRVNLLSLVGYLQTGSDGWQWGLQLKFKSELKATDHVWASVGHTHTRHVGFLRNHYLPAAVWGCQCVNC